MPENYAPPTMRAEELVARPVWSILAKGHTGSGKTVFALGKEFRPAYAFMLEERFESVLTYYKKLDGHLKDVYLNTFGMGDFYSLDQKMDEIVKRPEYKTVVMSGLSAYVDTVLVNLMGATKKESQRKKGGITVPILEDYNFEDSAIIFELIGDFLLELKKIGVNIFLEAHITPYEIVSLQEGQRTTQTLNQILTKGKKAPARIPTYFNEVWLFEKIYETEWKAGEKPKGARYLINTTGTSTDPCKTSFDIPNFEWTGIDGTVKLMEYLKDDVKNNPRVDPNAPKRVAW